MEEEGGRSVILLFILFLPAVIRGGEGNRLSKFLFKGNYLLSISMEIADAKKADKKGCLKLELARAGIFVVRLNLLVAA